MAILAFEEKDEEEIKKKPCEYYGRNGTRRSIRNM